MWLCVVCITAALSSCRAEPFYHTDYSHYAGSENYGSSISYNSYHSSPSSAYYDQSYSSSDSPHPISDTSSGTFGSASTQSYSPSSFSHFSSSTAPSAYRHSQHTSSTGQTTPPLLSSSRRGPFAGLRTNSAEVFPSPPPPALVSRQPRHDSSDVSPERRQELEEEVGDYDNPPFELMEPDAHYTSLYLLDRPLAIVNEESNGTEQTNFIRYPSPPPPKRYSTKPMFEPIRDGEQSGVITRTIAAKGLLRTNRESV